MGDILTPEQWFELKSRIRLQYPELTEDDLQYHEATEQDLMTMIQCSLLRTKKKIQGIIAGQYRVSPLTYHLRYERSRRNKQNIKS